LLDASRAANTLSKLRRHRTEHWVLTGGLAVEVHRMRFGSCSSNRPLNDIDFIVPSFECVPKSMNRDFLCRHIHPFDPPGKTLAQFIDGESRIRVDIFRAYGTTLSRVLPVRLSVGNLQVVSPKDLAARLVRLILPLAEGRTVALKHAGDLVRLLEIVTPAKAEDAWFDHRLPEQPINFADACRRASKLLLSRRELLTIPEYSKNPSEQCGRCVPDKHFPLVDPATMLSIMGYC
jgi:hypothetical protein